MQLPALTEEGTGFPRTGVIASVKPYDVCAGSEFRFSVREASVLN